MGPCVRHDPPPRPNIAIQPAGRMTKYDCSRFRAALQAKSFLDAGAIGPDGITRRASTLSWGYPEANKTQSTTPDWRPNLQPFAAIRMAAGLLSSPSQVRKSRVTGRRSFG